VAKLGATASGRARAEAIAEGRGNLPQRGAFQRSLGSIANAAGPDVPIETKSILKSSNR
jgi:hypothetical protein